MAVISFRDPVHNFMQFNHGEVKIIDLDVMQRLRGIRQLALASLVYPGTLHTRFDHTLGVTHVAGQMAEELGLDDEEKSLVRQAALLHDIGHGPFSHVSEYALERFSDRRKMPEGVKQDKIHEVITSHLIRNHPPLRDKLGKDNCERVAALLSVGIGDPILKSIVSGPLDADKQDYLLRDSFHAGVNYGIFDIRQLQRSLICQTIDGQRHLHIKKHGVHAVEQFVMAKYYLTTMVYQHKVRLISDQMIVRAIVLGIEKDQIKELESIYAFDQTDEFYGNYLKWNDARFMDRFGEQGKSGSKCKDLVDRLINRNLLKRVFYDSAKEFDLESKERLLQIGQREHSDIRSSIESEIASILKDELHVQIDPDFVILHTYQIKSVRESSRNDEASILVSKDSESHKLFENDSVLFSSINERMADEYVEVYAPVSWSDHSQRVRITNAIKSKIKEIISQKTRSIQLTLNL